ncbi:MULTISPECIES: PepSY-associated TM helix domain-containing protein [Rhizobium/Agrobacterium group]|uniref:Integral membrane protein n=2 Tax=Rhizobium/Agrobacterium group TaxID=227290 RepID=B9JUD0_ALLAM|nr:MULTISPECIES: PepSY domain-containing protein [Rhizobium/Agrobacterium group]ACM38053.1 integral membrane protein [Allorhizobium ampelinum S4]MCF1446846.1 PepSY domain-containing protein [Allorhizobium ampelinum]MUO28883.1 PepSY domain-containing protein [Agrobacterium vitis]MUO42839.1 PepSY domain-containing protein [Agrobacterium vitis]MUP09853.1 PepSY domain-containing protein [Agrobacterium vitis]
MSTITSLPVEKPVAASTRGFYFAAWRWHFYAGLYVAPFLIVLAVTGLIMMWSATLVGRDGEKAFTVTPTSAQTLVSQQADAALSAIPGGVIAQYIAPATPESVAVFRVNRGQESMMVAINPYDAQVLGQWSRRTALYDLAESIHGDLLIGTLGDRLIEIAAGFGVVLIITGLYMWWPRQGESYLRLLIPSFAEKGRQLWKSLHRTIGFYASILLLVFLVSGLSWAGIWGEKFTQAWSTFPIGKWSDAPLSDATHATMNHGSIKDVPWTLEQAPMPMSGSAAGHAGLPGGQTVTLDNVIAFARAIGFDHRFQLNFPKDETGVWSISRDTMSNDSTNPLLDRTVHIDRYSGKVLADIKYENYGLAGKAMAVGVSFHMGTIGLWNLALVTVYCLAVIFLSVSGIVMWWIRRPKGASRLMAPAYPSDMRLWKTGAIVMLLTSLLFPLTGAALLAVILLDMVLIRRIRPLKRALS